MEHSSKTTSVHDAVEHIREHGDIVDADPRLYRNSGTLENLAVTALAAVPIGLYTEALTPDRAVAYSVYGPAAAGVAYVLDRARRNRRVGQAYDMQRVVNDHLQEPVDLIQYSTREGKGLMLRWYGFEAVNTDTIPEGFIERARVITSFAREHGIDVVATVLPTTLAGSTPVQEGSRVVDDTKQLRHSYVWDDAAAEAVATVRPGELDLLLDQAEMEVESTLVDEIIERLQNDRIDRKFKEVERSNGHQEAYADLQAAVGREIETASADVSSTAFRMADGARLRQKVHSDLSVTARGRFMQLDSAANPINGEGSVGVADVNELARLVSKLSNNEFLDALTNTNLEDLSQNELLIGLYLLLEQRLDVSAKFTRRQIESGTQNDAAILPLYERIAAKKTGSIEQHGRLNALFYTKVWAKKLGAIAFGVGLGASLVHLDDVAFSREDARLHAYIQSHNLQNEEGSEYSYPTSPDKFYKQFVHDSSSGHSELSATYMESMNKAYEVDGQVTDAVASFLINDLHASVLGKLFPSLDSKAKADWEGQVASHKDPQDPYAQVGDNEMIGDVAGTSNKVMFTINDLTGESSSGYWRSRMDEELTVIEGSGPFNGGNVALTSVYTSLYKNISFKNTADDFSANDADFMVSTPYVDAGKHPTMSIAGVALPVKQHTMMVAARVIDSEHPERRVEAAIERNFEGNYQYASSQMDEKLRAANISHPVLEYWLKNVSPDEAERNMSNIVKLHIGDSRQGELVSKQDRLAVANATKEALGLPDDASALDIYNAISDKQYSYTPLEREGAANSKVDDEDAAVTLKQIGQILAKLKTMNCNIASMTMLLATLDEPAYFQQTGYHNGKDNVLTQQEAHAWLVKSRNGEIVDPTPSKMAPGEKLRTGIDAAESPKSHSPLITPERGAAALLGGVFAYVAYRRRKYIGVKSDAARTWLALGSKPMQHTFAGLEHDLYARPGSKGNASLHKTEPLASAAARYVRHIPTANDVKVAGTAHVSKAGRIVLRLNDAAVRRHVARN